MSRVVACWGGKRRAGGSSQEEIKGHGWLVEPVAGRLLSGVRKGKVQNFPEWSARKKSGGKNKQISWRRSHVFLCKRMERKEGEDMHDIPDHN